MQVSLSIELPVQVSYLCNELYDLDKDAKWSVFRYDEARASWKQTDNDAL